jgi:hypothetical protein
MVQGCPLSSTLFNICLEEFPWGIEKDDLKKLGYCVKLQDNSEIYINAAAYADELTSYTDPNDHMKTLIFLLSQFCAHAKMKVNTDKCVSISEVWNRGKADRDPEPFVIHADHGDEEIPMELVSIYIGMPIGFNRFENTKQHWSPCWKTREQLADRSCESLKRCMRSRHLCSRGLIIE